MPRRRFVTGELQFGPPGAGACAGAGHPLRWGQPGAEAVKHVLGAAQCGRSHGNARGLGGAAPQGSSDGKCLPSGKPEDRLARGMEEVAH